MAKKLIEKGIAIFLRPNNMAPSLEGSEQREK
jgi:hypothetical protein